MKANEKCPCCMEVHTPMRIRICEHNVFQGVAVEYEAEYYYCDAADETYADEKQIRMNHQAMIEAFLHSRRG